MKSFNSTPFPFDNPKSKMSPLLLAFLLFMGIFFCHSSFAQEAAEEDPIILRDRSIKDPKTATILSAVLPGAGQVYNEKVWKVPIIYGGIITNAYFAEFNNRRYKVFRKALFALDRQEPNPAFPNLNRDALVRNVNYWRKNRDLVFVFFGIIYALNIIDAQVDAHLSGFDISDDLTLKLEPSFESHSAGGNTFGMSLKLKF
ncbi:hypothetical protein P872_15410 [Rhodonellum psychrophilum GCM71 = DSM 17998]|uniref:DUF5683 domain-containing protein n=3 Tax=Cytophagaceae TaxID=89373 RepID=U5C2X7_9BACT|nr:hypothetical protein P872_15410 [Rhodonellum psychrophilum GCM71 = DSM 17998]SDZ19772.1 hypothetical protein SAMN05444412_107145 [Rhodonellum ikkaensis]